MTPAVNGGLAATAADDGVAATTTTSHLRAAVAKRVCDGHDGRQWGAATMATSCLWAAAASQSLV